jgi:ComF family protein
VEGLSKYLMNKNFLNNIYNVFFPIKCGYCDDITENGSYICEKCDTIIDLQELKNRCKFCGTKLFDKNRVCEKCKKEKKYYDEFIYFSEYEYVLKNKILEYKFNDKKYLKDFFAQELAKCLQNVQADYIIGVPISKKRLKERGYNQTNLIAKELSKILGIEYISEMLVKIKDTERQSELSKSERKINVKNSFRVTDIYNIEGKKILLIDDIFTTGATVNECSKTLKKAGAKQVIIATVLKKK